MSKSRTEEQIISTLNKAEAGVPVAELCRQEGIAVSTFYKWRSKYGGLEVSELKRFKQLERDYARLQKMYADLSLKSQINRVHRTGTGVDHRLAFPPEFSGVVQQNAHYFLVDDTLTLGGTLAPLRGYIVNRGGLVVGAAALSAHPNSLQLLQRMKYLATFRKNMVLPWMIILKRSLTMESTISLKQKPHTSMPHLILTPSEIESLKQDMLKSSEWARQELARQKAQKRIKNLLK